MSKSVFYIYEIKQSIDWISEDTAGLTFDTFRQSRRAVQLVDRNLLVISEAARNLPDTFLDQHPEIPWPDIKGIGNVLRHDYANVMPTVLWAIVTDHLDSLASVIDTEISRLDTEKRP